MRDTLKWFRSLANHVSARTRIALGLVLLLVSVLWLATSLGIIPNERVSVMAARAKFCEAVAVHSSVFVERNDLKALDVTLRAMLARDPDIQSAAVRDSDGRVLLGLGEHEAHWNKLTGQAALESYIYVPIFANDARWGTLEIRFQPLSKGGVMGYVQTPLARLIVFVASASMALYLLYLRKMLQHLDPSRVVPSRVRSALDTLAEGLMVLDNDERIVLANQAFASIIGRSPEQLLGLRPSQFAWVREGEMTLADYPWTAALRDGAGRMGVVLRLTDAAGLRRTFTVNCSPVMGHDGKYRGVLASFDDISQLEQKEVELRKSKDAAEAANHAKSDFLARMSHEIRTPMNAILGFAEVLRRGFEESELQRQEYLETIHASGQHLLELINDILDLSKIEAGKLEIELGRYSPHRIVKEVASVLSVRAKQKGISLDIEWAGSLPETIETDATRVRQALTNLVGNAIKFTESGSVRILTRLTQADGAPRLVIDVVDSGIGMKPDVLGRIFQPFAQADTSITRRFGGTGLGLSISQQIAEALGGGLTVASEYGKGSTFTLSLNIGAIEGIPMVTAETADAAAPASSIGSDLAVRLSASRVLLVEDGESNRKLITLVLQRAGAVVQAADNGKTGAEMALAGGYDLVLMDMQMPIMDGYTAAALLRREGFRAPIIALTAHAMRGDEEKCRSAGCSGFLTKPINMDLLVRTVHDAIEGNGHPLPAANATPSATAEVSKNSRAALVSTLPSDDPEFCEIILEFIGRFHQQLNAMQEAWSNGDLAQLAALAHWVKGSGGTAGFPALTEPARQLEQLAREKRLDEIGAGILALRDLAERIVPPPSPRLLPAAA